MDEAAVLKEMAVAGEEVGAGEALRGLLHLRVGEGEPYFLHFAGGEEVVDDLDVRAQEGDILQTFLQRLRGTAPHARTFDIHADEVAVGVAPRQPHGILAAAAAQLQHDGVVVLEELLAPTATQGE